MRIVVPVRYDLAKGGGLGGKEEGGRTNGYGSQVRDIQRPCYTAHETASSQPDPFPLSLSPNNNNI